MLQKEGDKMNVFVLSAGREELDIIGVFPIISHAARFAIQHAKNCFYNVKFINPDETNDPERLGRNVWEELEPGFYFAKVGFMNYSIEMHVMNLDGMQEVPDETQETEHGE